MNRTAASLSRPRAFPRAGGLGRGAFAAAAAFFCLCRAGTAFAAGLVWNQPCDFRYADGGKSYEPAPKPYVCDYIQTQDPGARTEFQKSWSPTQQSAYLKRETAQAESAHQDYLSALQGLKTRENPAALSASLPPAARADQLARMQAEVEAQGRDAARLFGQSYATPFEEQASAISASLSQARRRLDSRQKAELARRQALFTAQGEGNPAGALRRAAASLRRDNAEAVGGRLFDNSGGGGAAAAGSAAAAVGRGAAAPGIFASRTSAYDRLGAAHAPPPPQPAYRLGVMDRSLLWVSDKVGAKNIDRAANFSAGFGDQLLLVPGAGRELRKLAGVAPGTVNDASVDYAHGGMTGAVAIMVAPLGLAKPAALGATVTITRFGPAIAEDGTAAIKEGQFVMQGAKAGFEGAENWLRAGGPELLAKNGARYLSSVEAEVPSSMLRYPIKEEGVVMGTLKGWLGQRVYTGPMVAGL